MSSQTFHTTAQDLRKQETRSGMQHKGQTPKDAEVSQLKVSWSANCDNLAPILTILLNSP